jgi:hypothetical protein
MHGVGVGLEWVRGCLAKREAKLRDTITDPEPSAATVAACSEIIDAR